jgi:hypothetical protein
VLVVSAVGNEDYDRAIADFGQTIRLDCVHAD